MPASRSSNLPVFYTLNTCDSDTVELNQVTGFTRDEEIWYDDGNIVLVAGNVGFRVYRGLLAKRSEVFNDLFTVPQPQDSWLVYGCPVVHLSDTPDALRELLGVLLCGKRYIWRSDIELDLLSYRIRLAHKYGIEDLLAESVRQLKQLFPATLDAWRDLERHDSPRAITAINLAHLTNTPSVLPSALYVCCLLANHHLLDGAPHPDGTVNMLGREDLLRCMKAKVQFVRRLTNDIHNMSLPAANIANCTSAGMCSLAFHNFKNAALPRYDLLDTFRKREYNVNYTALCEACIALLQSKMAQSEENLWAKLPRFFDLPVDKTWDQEDFDSEVE
ncbi:uncharacterized protein C8Q71DRAFT_797587 [Rhodofomes roseus]|uniref:BTB domain-containing protein n=1 Tax=Rhodofomes roseus TaxID=34475 RepID=A0ABQ8KD53_9APHY|nr:uncharacterized protein C8Q71DRAFT_797587 [Rhodofomes roseus]KAH9835467.1 hypothetical protein C8Q71DRAFT_797587 [Rhodofomes roseus]